MRGRAGQVGSLGRALQAAAHMLPPCPPPPYTPCTHTRTRIPHSQPPPSDQREPALQRTCRPAPASPSQEAGSGVCCSPRWVLTGPVLRCSSQSALCPFSWSPFISMFTLMRYALISHGPSPPSRMGLWGDIPRHPLTGKDPPAQEGSYSAWSLSGCHCTLLHFSGVSPVDLPGQKHGRGSWFYSTPSPGS